MKLAPNARSSFHHLLLPPEFSNRYTAIKFSCNSHTCNVYAISNRYKTRFLRPPRPIHSMPFAPGRLVRAPLFLPPASRLPVLASSRLLPYPTTAQVAQALLPARPAAACGALRTPARLENALSQLQRNHPGRQLHGD